jgi:hypothetical protein
MTKDTTAVVGNQGRKVARGSVDPDRFEELIEASKDGDLKRAASALGSMLDDCFERSDKSSKPNKNADKVLVDPFSLLTRLRNGPYNAKTSEFVTMVEIMFTLDADGKAPIYHAARNGHLVMINTYLSLFVSGVLLSRQTRCSRKFVSKSQSLTFYEWLIRIKYFGNSKVKRNRVKEFSDWACCSSEEKVVDAFCNNPISLDDIVSTVCEESNCFDAFLCDLVPLSPAMISSEGDEAYPTNGDDAFLQYVASRTTTSPEQYECMQFPSQPTVPKRQAAIISEETKKVEEDEVVMGSAEKAERNCSLDDEDYSIDLVSEIDILSLGDNETDETEDDSGDIGDDWEELSCPVRPVGDIPQNEVLDSVAWLYKPTTMGIQSQNKY